jgi:hypothetical protein
MNIFVFFQVCRVFADVLPSLTKRCFLDPGELFAETSFTTLKAPEFQPLLLMQFGLIWPSGSMLYGLWYCLISLLKLDCCTASSS